MVSVELFDIVDENNNLLYITKPRDIVHKEMTYWHRATHIWIANAQGDILCQQRSLSKDANPWKWQSFFGGHLKAGETYEENAIKELNEELGINASLSDLVLLYLRKSESAKHFTNVYVIEWNGSISDLSFNDEEVEKAEWMNLSSLSEKIENGDFCNKIDEEVVSYLQKNYIS